MLENLKSKLTPKNKRWLIIGGFFALGIVIGVVFLMFPYKNKSVQLDELQAQLKQKHDQLDAKRFSHTELQNERGKKDDKIRELARLEKGLPEEEYVPTLLTMLEDLSAEVRSRITSISPSQPTSPQIAPASSAAGTTDANAAAAAVLTYKEMTLSIPFNGTYDNLKLLINRLAQFPMVVVVTSLSVSGGGSIDATEGVPLVSAALPTTIYILPKNSSSGESAKPPGS